MEKIEGLEYNHPWINLESPNEFRIIGDIALQCLITSIKANWGNGREVVITAKQVRFIPLEITTCQDKEKPAQHTCN